MQEICKVSKNFKTPFLIISWAKCKKVGQISFCPPPPPYVFSSCICICPMALYLNILIHKIVESKICISIGWLGYTYTISRKFILHNDASIFFGKLMINKVIGYS
jgi:hypothetical protein